MKKHQCKFCKTLFIKAKSYSNHTRYGCPIEKWGVEYKKNYRLYKWRENKEKQKAYRKEYLKTEKGKIVHKEAAKRHMKNNPIKYKARYILRNAITSGKLIRLPCEICKEPITEAHHSDYTKPLDVRWLCNQHHREIHQGLT